MGQAFQDLLPKKESAHQDPGWTRQLIVAGYGSIINTRKMIESADNRFSLNRSKINKALISRIQGSIMAPLSFRILDLKKRHQ